MCQEHIASTGNAHNRSPCAGAMPSWLICVLKNQWPDFWGSRERVHVKARWAWRWAWRKGQDKGQKERCCIAHGEALPRGTKHTGGGTSDSLSFYSGAPQDLRLSCTLHGCVQHGPCCPPEAAWEVLECACHPTPLRPPEGLLCLWIVPQACWGPGVCGAEPGPRRCIPGSVLLSSAVWGHATYQREQNSLTPSSQGEPEVPPPCAQFNLVTWSGQSRCSFCLLLKL